MTSSRTPAGRVRIRIVLTLVFAVACVGFVASWTPTHDSQPQWSLLLHQGGAYQLTGSGTSAFRATGLTLALTNNRSVPSGYEQVGDGTRYPVGNGVRYIDPDPMFFVSDYVLAKYPSCRAVTTPCPISAADRTYMLDHVKKLLAAARDQPSVVGYYILDDYPGNIVGLLEQVHALVAASNRELATPRPTVCGFGATLDFRAAPGQPFTPATLERNEYQNVELLNFSPKACDIVTLGVYARDGEPDSDFSMNRLMPFLLGALRRHGWDPAREPLFGTPMAWGSLAPTVSQLRTQTAAFCGAGAQSIVAFTWANFPPPGALRELANDARLRAGLVEGLKACQGIWNRGS